MRITGRVLAVLLLFLAAACSGPAEPGMPPSTIGVETPTTIAAAPPGTSSTVPATTTPPSAWSGPPCPHPPPGTEI